MFFMSSLPDRSGTRVPWYEPDAIKADIIFFQ